MRDFHCACGARVFFENSGCLACGRQLGFDPQSLDIKALDRHSGPQVWRAAGADEHASFRVCANRSKHCNWLLPDTDERGFCLSCRLTLTIPDLSMFKNNVLWARLEVAKRRLLYNLLSLGLPVDSGSLQFEFLEDSRTNPMMREMQVYTGHRDGVITINVAEADDVSREAIREAMGEPYRTLLGHLRHESGHYYWKIVINSDAARTECRQLFGDERADYQQALQRYYDNGPPPDWAEHFITPYAASHPQEDWAECWAHFLHIADGLETGRTGGWLPPDAGIESEAWLDRWSETTIQLNEMNRGLGLPNAYPFTLTPGTRRKLEFIRRQVGFPPAPH
jgi:hypothetical protein